MVEFSRFDLCNIVRELPAFSDVQLAPNEELQTLRRENMDSLHADEQNDVSSKPFSMTDWIRAAEV